jgi:uncharacterized protein YndB with AHSA1/START domain
MTSDVTVTIETPWAREVVVTRRFKAPRQMVFDALTEPELVRRWYGPSGAMDICDSDPRAGGVWRYVTKLKNGKTVGQFGTYTEVSAPERFVRTERWDDWDPGETVCTVVLVETNGVTTMTQSMVFPSQEVRDVVLKGGLTPKGTSEFYDRLEKLLSVL